MSRTAAETRTTSERILKAWRRCPDLRFGQFVQLAADIEIQEVDRISDQALARAAEALADERNGTG